MKFSANNFDMCVFAECDRRLQNRNSEQLNRLLMTRNLLYQRTPLLLFYAMLSMLTFLPQWSSANSNGSTGYYNKTFLPVRGKVTSTTDQQPLAGVSVTIKGTTIGTATDDAGNYSFNNVENNATLVFSFVG